MSRWTVLLLVSLLTYHPFDRSLFFRGDDSQKTLNWIGPAGAEFSELVLGVFGITGFLIPILLAWAGYRKLRRLTSEKVVGRGFGIAATLVALPPLVQLLLGEVGWRGEALDAGGVFGRLAVTFMEAKLHFLGSLLVLVGVMVVGLALALQSSLDELVAHWAGRGRGVLSSWALRFQQRRDRQNRDRARQKVVAKHLERARERKGEKKDLLSARVSKGRSAEVEGETSEAARPVLRFRVRRGPGKAGIRRVKASESQAYQAEPDSGHAPLEDGAFDHESGHFDELSLQPGANVEPQPAPPAQRQKSASSAPPVRRPRSKSIEKDADPGSGIKQQTLPMPKRARKGALPPLNLLNLEKARPSIDEDELVRLGEVIRQRCAEFGVEGTIEGIGPGPVITVFEFQPAPGVKVSKIVNLQDDLALSLKASAIRIDRIPGRSTLGIEVPNDERSIIRLGSLLADENFKKAKSPLTMALGQTLHGDNLFVDLATMPHLLVAGATGAGKSVGLQAMITSILYKASREDVQFIFIDPKRIELGVYSDIPHLKAPVVVDAKKASNALRWAVVEMERRYKLLAEVHVRSIDFYNRAINDPEVQKRLSLKEDDGTGDDEITKDDLTPLPYYVIIIDELADLMMVASSDVEHSIARLAQMARAVGIHLIIATQRPSVDVLTGMIKANFPCRIAFATASRHDSRTILDQIGAEKLLGKGDALFMPPGSSRIMRLHGAYVSEQETAALIRWLKKQGPPELDKSILEAPVEERSTEGGGSADQDDPLFDDAARLVVKEGKASASFLQRRMRIGFSRASRLVDLMEQDGLVGPAQGSKPREILVAADYFEEIDHHE